MPPQKKNILYCVKEKRTIDMVVKRLCVPLRELSIQMPRIILFCKCYDQCSLLYHAFKVELNDSFTYPSGAPDLAKYRLVDMYTRCTEAKVKESILSSFCASGWTSTHCYSNNSFWHGIGLRKIFVKLFIGVHPQTMGLIFKKVVGLAGMDICLMQPYFMVLVMENLLVVK